MREKEAATFLGVPAARVDQLDDADVVIIGAPQGTPYEPGRSSHSAGAPTAIRAASTRYASWLAHHDFDFGSVLLDAAKTRVVDCGDIAGDSATPASNRDNITAAVNTILANDTVPVLLGGDDSVPIPFMAAFAGHGPIWIVQVDAHIDWRQSRNGVELGWSSTMRRASEMTWVEGIVQVGIRGVGSALPEDLADARDWGARIITARQLHERGVDEALRYLPEGASCILSLDCDGLDPSVMPGVMAPAPGGLTYYQALDLIAGVGRRCRLAGFAVVELAPERDQSGITALTAGRLVSAAINAAAR